MSLANEQERDKESYSSPMITPVVAAVAAVSVYPQGNESAENVYDKKQPHNGFVSMDDAERINPNHIHTPPTTKTPSPAIVQPPSPTIPPISASESDLDEVVSSNPDDASPPESAEPGQLRRPRTIRFNSRVRITSGVGRSNKTSHKERSSSTKQTDSGPTVEPLQLPSNNASTGATDVPQPPKRTNSTQSVGSNASGSYTSSIMVPLRSSSELPPRPNSLRVNNKQRKPITSVLETQDANAWLHSMAVERRLRREKRRSAVNINNDRAPLLRGAASHPVYDEDVDDNDAEASDEDILSSQSPWRYLSLYYWEARLSSLCCCDSEQED